jgi:hypothetical protein
MPRRTAGGRHHRALCPNGPNVRTGHGGYSDTASAIVSSDADADRVGAGAERIGRSLRHPDRPARLGNAAALGQRLDEIDLPLGRPAIEPDARAGGLELEWFEVVRGGGGVRMQGRPIG